MDITVKGLKHPHRYVLDAAQTHIYMLMKKVGRLAESARKSSRLWVPGCGGRGRVWSRPEVLPSLGPRMRGKGACVVVALLLLGADLSAVSSTCSRAGPSLCSRALWPGRSSC